MNNDYSLIPPRFQELASRLGASFGINSDATTLMMMQAAGLAFGSTMQSQTPDLRRLSPAFNVALVSPPVSLPRAVFATLVDPIGEVLRGFAIRRDEAGMAALKNEHDMLQTRRRDLSKIIAGHETALDKEKQEPECFGIGYAARCAATRLRHEEIEEAKKMISKIDSDRDDLLLMLGPGILVDEPPWRNLPSLALAAFDGTVLATRFENGAGGLGNLTGKQLEVLGETLLRPRLEATGVTMILNDHEDAYAQVLSNRRVFNSVILQNFIFVETGSKPTGPFPLHDLGKGMDEWTNFLFDAFKLRVEGRERLFMVDEKGYERLMEFHYWCLEQLQGSTTDMAPFFMSWRNHCLRLALIRTAMEGGAKNEVIPAKYVNETAEFLMRLARSQFTLLERMISGNPEEEKWARVEQLVGKLQVRGPMTRRSIVRCFNNQDYRTIDALIAMDVAEGRIEQRGAFFVSKGVSVSASAA